MTTAINELCEDTEDLRQELLHRLESLLGAILEPLELGKPGYKGHFIANHDSGVVSLSWRYDSAVEGYWPRNSRPLRAVRSILFKVGKEFVGQPVTLFNGVAHPTTVNAQGLISYQGEEAMKIFADTSNLRFMIN